MQQLQQLNEDLKISALQCIQSVTNGILLPMVPYFLNPQLLDLLLSLIKSDQSQTVQRLAAKTLVIVGALDYNI